MTKTLQTAAAATLTIAHKELFGLGAKATSGDMAKAFKAGPSVETALPMLLTFGTALADLGQFAIADLVAALAAAPAPKAKKPAKAKAAVAPVEPVAAPKAKKVKADKPVDVIAIDASAVAAEMESLFPVGSVVNALWPEDGSYWTALVKAHKADGTLKVVYADGTKAKRTVDELKVLKGKALKAAKIEHGLVEVPAPELPALPVITHDLKKGMDVLLTRGRGKKAIAGKITAFNATECVVKDSDGNRHTALISAVRNIAEVKKAA